MGKSWKALGKALKSYLTLFFIGAMASIQGNRSLTLTWGIPSRYSNQPATVRTITGRVRL